MLDSEVSEEDLARVPRLASDCDPTALALSPAEGFLLSRIDGQTSWKLLREIGGLSSDEVDLCIEEWLQQGFIDIDGRAPRVQRRKASASDPPSKPKVVLIGPIDESLIDPELDLNEAMQREILEFEQKLEIDEFGVLGVNPSADSREIKRAYFSLSKRFHPDRYFRKKIGDYENRLHTIFKRVSEAYELLNDSASRAEIEARLSPFQSVGFDPGDEATTGSETVAKQKPLSKIERLRRRMAQRVPASVREEKAAKGAELYKVAMQALKMGRFTEAASSMRLAVAFDPFNRDYKRSLGEVQAKLAFEHIEELLAEPNGVLTDRERSEASRLADEVLLHGAKDAATCDLAARVYLKIEDADRAEEYSKRAIEFDPDDSAYQRTLAGVHKLRGNNGHAMFVLQKALELDSGDMEAKQMLDALKIKPRRLSANGG